MSDRPPGGPGEPGDPTPDPWDAWRRWEPGSSRDEDRSGAWDAWKSWSWDPRSARRFSAGTGAGSPSGAILVKLLVAGIIGVFLLSFVLGASAEPEELAADDLIAAIDALPVTGPRDQRPPDRSAGETATFPAAADPVAVADAIAGVRAPAQRQTSDATAYLLYEEATVVAQPAPGGSEVVVFEDNRSATRRHPVLIGFPGWRVALDDFDARARSRGGIGGFRGGGGGLGK